MNSISDPGRPGRRDRRRAQKLIDTAFAEQRLTVADRTLRTQRIEAAHTRGDLAMITRDILAPTQTNLGRVLPPPASIPRPGTPAPTFGQGTPTIDLSGIGRKVRLFVLIAVGVTLASCALGLVGFIPVIMSAVDNAPSSGTAEWTPVPAQSSRPGGTATSVREPAAGLHTVAGWTQLVDAIEAKSGTTEVYDLVVYPQYASVALDGKGAAERRFYRDGAWQDSVSVRTPAVGSLIELAGIDADLIARLPAEVARHFEIDDPTGTYIIVNSFAGSPRIMVYVQTDGPSHYRAYQLDGTPIS